MIFHVFSSFRHTFGEEKCVFGDFRVFPGALPGVARFRTPKTLILQAFTIGSEASLFENFLGCPWGALVSGFGDLLGFVSGYVYFVSGRLFLVFSLDHSTRQLDQNSVSPHGSIVFPRSPVRFPTVRDAHSMLALTARAQSRYETCGCPYRECTDDAHFVARGSPAIGCQMD